MAKGSRFSPGYIIFLIFVTRLQSAIIICLFRNFFQKSFPVIYLKVRLISFDLELSEPHQRDDESITV